MNLNNVVIAGRLTRDPELRYSGKGAAICKVSLAIGRKWKDQAGETKEETTFVDCTAFGKTAELAGQYLTKGQVALLTGRLHLETWDDKATGQKRSRLGVIVDQVQFGPKPREDSGQPPASPGRQTPAPADTTEPAPADDVPF